ncbi:hypothetical protein M758_10G098900 [Ceratodon purpureus]|nr:hypothetical protein M758_10G098900 [Ceratodon purpureus]
MSLPPSKSLQTLLPRVFAGLSNQVQRHRGTLTSFFRAQMAPGETVCVTGAGGFIASWVVKLLLEKGYNVKGTVRSPEKSQHLLALDGAHDRLRLVAADIRTPGIFDSIFEGCDGVFHIASFVPGNDKLIPEAEIEEISIKGTLNVLESCAKTRPKRIVFTSSLMAVNLTPKATPGTVVDETFFTDVDFVRKSELNPYAKAYATGKTLAEEAAWDFVKKHNLNLVVMNPVFVVGPVIQPTLNATNEFPVDLLSGKQEVILNHSTVWVGVKDVANAHVLGYENPEAEGRYILAERSLHDFDFAALLQKLFPQYTVKARKNNDDQPRVPVYAVSTKKVREHLGLQFEPLEDVLRETIECFRKLKYLD